MTRFGTRVRKKPMRVVKHGSTDTSGVFHHVPSMWDMMITNPWRIHGAAIYGVPWVPSIYPSHVSIYTSTMDPSWEMISMIDINLIGRFQDFWSCHHSSWIIQAPWAFRAQLFALLMEVPPCGACFEGLGYYACDIPRIVIFLKLGHPVVSQSSSFPDDWVTSLGYVGSTFLRNPQLPVSRRVQDPTCIGLGPWGRSWNPGRELIWGFKHYLGVSELGGTPKITKIRL